jgi:hypothetical protein
VTILQKDSRQRICGTFHAVCITSEEQRDAIAPAAHLETRMMEKNSRISKIALYQNLGFLAILGLCYLNDLVKLPLLVLSDHPLLALYRRSTLEILLVLTVWFLVSLSTRRVLDRIRYLEQFTRVCAWCRRIDYKSRWMPWEEFLKQGFDTPTTHGICPECLQRQKAAIEAARKQRELKDAPAES